MQITKLVLDNFSSYEGKNIFDFTVKRDKPIVLIGGQNGAGKTSIFTAIKIALYGPLAFGYTGNNAFYSKKIKSYINDRAFQSQSFSSGVSIKIQCKKKSLMAAISRLFLFNLNCAGVNIRIMHVVYAYSTKYVCGD